MIQIIFLIFVVMALLFVRALAGSFVDPGLSPKLPDLLNPAAEYSDEIVTTSRKTTDLINVTNIKGIVQIHKQMDDLAQQQKKIQEMIQEEQILANANKEANDILSGVQKGVPKSKDILQLQALASAMQDEERLLIEGGQGLVALNSQVSDNRQQVSDQVNAANINNAFALQALQEHNEEQKQKVRDEMDEIKRKLQDMEDK